MQTKIQKWGNSQGLRLSKVFLDEIQASVGDDVEMFVQEGKIIIEPVKQIRRRYHLETLIADIPADYKSNEIDWGKPVGREEW